MLDISTACLMDHETDTHFPRAHLKISVECPQNSLGEMLTSEACQWRIEEGEHQRGQAEAGSSQEMAEPSGLGARGDSQLHAKM